MATADTPAASPPAGPKPTASEDPPDVPSASGKHLSPDGLAEREDVPVTTVYQWRSRGTGPPGFRVGRHVRYRLVDVIAWEERQLASDRHGAA